MENTFLSMYNMLDKVTVCGYQSHKRMTVVMDTLLELSKAHNIENEEKSYGNHDEQRKQA